MDFGEDISDAKRFAERVKRHQRRHFTKQRREFRKLQARLESQRRLGKARIKARQFATARRQAAQRVGKQDRKPARERSGRRSASPRLKNPESIGRHGAVIIDSQAQRS